MNSDNPLLKDIFFSQQFLDQLAADLAKQYASFDFTAFLNTFFAP